MTEPIDPYELGDMIEARSLENIRRALRCDVCGRILSDMVRLVDHYDLRHADE